MEAEVSPKESVEILKEAVHLYYDLAHPNLIKIIEEYDYNDFYIVVFEWANGECLFDHWNFETYERDSTLKSPKDKFKELPVSKKLKAPEEYMKGCAIDEQTNIFTLGALIFEFFGEFSDEEIYQRYCNNQFLPCSSSKWQLSEEAYRVATKAVSPDKSERYLIFAEFFAEWKSANSISFC